MSLSGVGMEEGGQLCRLVMGGSGAPPSHEHSH
jgi:hypothetical protein